MQQRLSIITLGVRDMAKAREFYLDGLGWKEAEASKAYEAITFIQMNGFLLGLFDHESLAEDANVPENRSDFRGFALAYNTRSREEVDEVLAHAKAAGATITKPAQDVFWGGYSGYFSDPDGFLWEVAFGLEAEITEEGYLILPE